MTRILAALLALTLLAGCSLNDGPRHPDAMALAEAEATPAPNVLFYRGLDNKPNATVHDAVRLAHTLHEHRTGAQGESRRGMAFTDYRDRLVEAGVISRGAYTDAQQMITHGAAADLFARALAWEGGVSWTALGLDRYAHRELVGAGLFPERNARQLMSGPEVLGAFRDCRTWLDTRPARN